MWIKTGGKKCYHLVFRLTRDIQLRWFRYRILHRVLATNSLLLKMKIMNKEQCSFCNTLVKTLTHLFWECIYVEEFWNKLIDWINSTLNVDIDITVIDVIFGRYRIFHNIFNLVLMITKRYI